MVVALLEGGEWTLTKHTTSSNHAQLADKAVEARQKRRLLNHPDSVINKGRVRIVSVRRVWPVSVSSVAGSVAGSVSSVMSRVSSVMSSVVGSVSSVSSVSR